jgi:hypothetical protein
MSPVLYFLSKLLDMSNFHSDTPLPLFQNVEVLHDIILLLPEANPLIKAAVHFIENSCNK